MTFLHRRKISYLKLRVALVEFGDEKNSKDQHDCKEHVRDNLDLLKLPPEDYGSMK